MNIREWIFENQNIWNRMSDSIWDCAELKFSEFQSVEILREYIEAQGFSVEAVSDIPTAFVASFGNSGPAIGFLGEFDALDQLSQQAGVAYKSQNTGHTTGHGCGHHLLGVGAMAAAVALKEYVVAHNIPATIHYFACPGEEGGSGKAFMARAGVFDSLDVAITWHPGYVNCIFSVSTLSNIQCAFHFSGRSAHAASSPHLGRSALDAVELMNMGCNYLREHIIQDARIHYAVTNTGGHSPNVVQSEAEVLYLIRAPKMSDTEEIYQRIQDIATGAALMTGTQMELRFDKACSSIIPNDVLCNMMSDIGRELQLPTYTQEELAFAEDIIHTFTDEECASASHINFTNDTLPEDMCSSPIAQYFLPYQSSSHVLPGSSDVGDVSRIVPTVQCIGNCYAYGTPSHSWQMVSQGKSSVAQKGMNYAAELMALTGLKLLQEPQLIKLAQEELLRRQNGVSYVSPIPNDVYPNATNEKK